MQKNAGVEHLLRASVLAGLQYYMQFMPQWRVFGGSMNDLIAQSGESMPIIENDYSWRRICLRDAIANSAMPKYCCCVGRHLDSGRKK